MGVVFELVVNFGRDVEAVERAESLVNRRSSVQLRDFNVPLGEPFVTYIPHRWPSRTDPLPPDVEYIEFAVHPRGIGAGGPGPRLPIDRDTITDEELGSVGMQLYDLLRGFDGYEAAMVGWDPEPVVEVAELTSEFSKEIRAGDLDGLVVSERLRTGLAPNDLFEPFTPGYVWIPYRGSKAWWNKPDNDES